ncbi:DNA-binding XRE family transcriptional regulator [Crossiella equi]|uniref:DNA-binding XRE family transcriptional regulator n=1 Tax=Crossiella equi TaxID=130796 RepID=A0ABS5AM61_9PSEU|nr:helix-turn-helix transcriptional regulator [Crossiella equi]MBP2477641.1 DNA-binding XRE family transcriptional regulator [Crossiella equi]
MSHSGAAEGLIATGIRHARRTLGLTQRGLARRSGLGRGTIRAAENPPPRWSPSTRVALVLITTLELPVEVAQALLALARPAPSPAAYARLAMGLTQAQAAAAVGIAQSTYHRYERGQRTPPPVVAARITALLGGPPPQPAARGSGPVPRGPNTASPTRDRLNAEGARHAEAAGPAHPGPHDRPG